MPPNPKTGFVMLPEVVTGELAYKFGEISLFNHRLAPVPGGNATCPS
jgi:hypothetical protein